MHPYQKTKHRTHRDAHRHRQDTDVQSASAPNSQLSATVIHRQNGSLVLTIARGRRSVLQPSPLGLSTQTADFTTGLRFLSREDRVVTENYTLSVGKRRDRHAVMHQMRLSFANADGARMDLLVRVADDGVAYRYVIPSTHPVSVTDEASAFQIGPNTPAWLLRYSSTYENIWTATEVAHATPRVEYAYPALFQVSIQDWLLLAEAKVIDQYGGTHLLLGDDHAFHVVLPDAVETSSGTMRTPWRVAIIGDLDQVVASELVNDLAPPSKVDDTSWIEPGPVAWSWWSDSNSPGDLATQKHYVDFAETMGWPYILVDAGWSAAGGQPGADFSTDPSSETLRRELSQSWVPELVDYAKARGVRILLWFQWRTLDSEREREIILSTLASWGVAGLKIDFMNSDSQARMHWYDHILEDTARYRLMVNFHGATPERGLQRTWPQVMTMEAVRGAEYYKSNAQGGPVHNVILPFTRNVVGSMDYTPVTFSASPRATSDGHELGLSVVYESGWQHFADSPASYDAHPLAEQFLKQVPTVWDETRLLDGYPGEMAVIARRHGQDWFVGAITAGAARTIDVPLDFLCGGPWLATLVQDDGHRGLNRRTLTLTRDDTQSVDVAANGGFVMHLQPI